MFGVDITDHYVVYDYDKQCRDAGSLYPAIDVELYGKKVSALTANRVVSRMPKNGLQKQERL